jgi:hypothetical protein
MSKATTGEAEVLRLRQSIETQMRRRILEAIELLLEQIGSFRSIVGEAPEAGIEPAIQIRKPARCQGLVQSERNGCVMATRPARRG